MIVKCSLARDLTSQAIHSRAGGNGRPKDLRAARKRVAVDVGEVLDGRAPECVLVLKLGNVAVGGGIVRKRN